MAVPLSLPIVLGAGVAGMGVGFLVWLHRDRPGARPLTIFVIAASCWALVQGLQLASGGLAGTRFWALVGLALSAFIPVAWFVTVLEYTGRTRWLAPRRLAVLLIEPLLVALLVGTNGGRGGHRLLWSNGRREFLDGVSTYAFDPGVAFWAHQVYVYLLVAAGGLLLLRVIVGSRALYRSQSTALLGAIAVPAFANALALFGFSLVGFDPTAVGYVLAGVVLAWAMFRFQLFSLSPVTRELGREEALADLDDRVIVLDDDDRIVDANPAAESLLGAPLERVLGEPLATVLPDLATALDEGGSDPAEDLALEHEGKLRYFDDRISEIARAGGTVSGRLVSLRDVTERRQREQRLDVLNRLLRHNLRNDLNVVRGNAALARAAVETPAVSERLDRVLETVDTIANRSDKIGRLTRILDSEALDPTALDRVVADAVRSVEHEYDGVEVAVDVPSGELVRGGRAVTAALEELLGNAVEHAGPDPEIAVRVDGGASDETWIALVVSDAGPGIDAHEYRSIVEGEETPLQHGSGVGLWLVNWIVTQVGGDVAFDATGDGTRITLLLPRAGQAPDRRDASGETNATPTTDDPDGVRVRPSEQGRPVDDPPPTD